MRIPLYKKIHEKVLLAQIYLLVHNHSINYYEENLVGFIQGCGHAVAFVYENHLVCNRLMCLQEKVLI